MRIINVMRYISAYLLAIAGGNSSPKVEDIKNILGAVGVDTDVEAAELVISRLQGKNIEHVIAEGSTGLVTISGDAPVAVAPAAAASATAAAPPPAESKPAKKEEKEESDDDLGFGLFD
ncbi:60s Acidic ribosomal protein [Dictyocaulus viviparus]|uniref:Large ribosomal subunit protein P2 n=1 Tax=Dictyocaulus viviparus TaxID=29172 RepID=A0A0D8Y5N2_DICVI|nr:60s Acidic ribosomal protein [Dictyocaulus viviparus]